MCSCSKIPWISPGWRVGLIALAGLAPTFCWGALQWEARQVQLTAKPGDREIVAAFQFKNTGSAPVTITQIRPACGCTTAELSKRIYSPGETGSIRVVFSLGDRVGLQEKLIGVVTDDPSGPLESLVLRVTIPELISCSPRLLLWTKGAGPTEQSVVLAATGTHPIASIEINGPTDGVTHRIEAAESGKRYRLFVRPVDVTKTLSVALHGQARLDDGTVQSFVVYALIK